MNWMVPAFAAIAVAIALEARERSRRALNSLLRALGRRAPQPFVNGLWIGAFAFTLGAVITLTTRWPEPGIHDEYSYLLAADTFAHGRLANPPHPFREHFESMHVLVEPTYASKYPPAQGLILAAGQALTSRPIVGAWLANALACMAVYWALLAWLPRRWALLGGLLSTIHPLVLEWGQCFWGGAAAMTGGGLLFGAYRRITRGPGLRVIDAVAMGTGLLILANSRPFEGFVFSLMIAIALMGWLRKQAGKWRPILWKLVLPVCLVLTIGGLGMGGYNYRVTGDPLKLPYSVHEATYSMTPLFVWQSAKPEPKYGNGQLREFWTGWALDFHQRQQTLRGWAYDCARKLWTLSKAYLWQLLLLPALFIALARWRGDRKARLGIVLIGSFALILFQVSWPLQPHYAAPFFPVFLLLLLQGLRHLRQCQWQGRHIGPAITVGLLTGCIASAGVFWVHHSRQAEGNFERAAMIRDLMDQGGHHLILVRYAAGHSPHDEWVYNGADIPESPVVWARDLGEVKNRRLLEHAARRTAWLLEADQKPRKLVPYPLNSQSTGVSP